MNPQQRQKTLVVLTVAVVALYLGDLVAFEPLAKWFSARSEAIATLRQKVKDGTQLVKREPGIHAQWDNMRMNTLPANGSQAEQQFLKSIDNWARQTGTEITDILPQWKSDADEYVTLNCRVEAGGNLSALTQFLYEIKKSPMALKMDSLQLSCRDNTGQLLTLDLQISGLVLVPKIQK
jgi:Tfp pilus assembly protein PilO